MTALVFPPPLSVGLVLGLEAFALGVVLWISAPWIARRRPGIEPYVAIGRTLAVVTGVVLVVAAVLGEQTPFSDLRNPVPDTVTSVTTGQALYQANCARCHGVDGRGGGPDAATTQVRPANLLSGHLDAHTDGDIYYWITNGLPGGMPAWASSLSDNDRWNLVNYLRSINGRGPAAPGGSGSAAPSGSPGTVGSVGRTSPATPGAGSASDAAGLLLVPGFGLLVGGWLATGFRRARRSRP
jgi:mono/diheme cytochrome c family protein